MSYFVGSLINIIDCTGPR